MAGGNQNNERDRPHDIHQNVQHRVSKPVLEDISGARGVQQGTHDQTEKTGNHHRDCDHVQGVENGGDEGFGDERIPVNRPGGGRQRHSRQ